MEYNFEQAWLRALEQRFGVEAKIAQVALEHRPNMLIYETKGLQAFWNAPGFHPYDPTRASIAGK
jgi:hypothetical protein